MHHKITYQGIKFSEKNKIGFLIFSNETGSQVEVPLPEAQARRVGLYLDRLATINRPMIERQNDEPSE